MFGINEEVLERPKLKGYDFFGIVAILLYLRSQPLSRFRLHYLVRREGLLVDYRKFQKHLSLCAKMKLVKVHSVDRYHGKIKETVSYEITEGGRRFLSLLQEYAFDLAM